MNVGTDHDEIKKLMDLWALKVETPAKAAGSAIPRPSGIYFPFRKVFQPILDFVKKVKEEKPDRIVAVVNPELVAPHWYEYLLHNVHAAGLRTLLFLERDNQTVVITTPWYLH